MKYKDPITGELKEIYLPPTGDTLPIGSIVAYSSTTAPTNWLICDGSEISRTTYIELFNIIGTTYGEGDGSTTFNLPNRKGKVGVGLDSSQAEFDTIGETGGEKTHTLTKSELPNVKLNVYGAGDTSGEDIFKFTNTSVSDTSTGARIGYTEPIGGGQAHNNLQPYIVQNYIIKAKNSVGLVGNVANENSTSTQDSYSCDYINKLKEEVWVNESPTKGFDGQILTLTKGYDYYILLVRRYASTDKILTYIIYPNSTSDINYSDYDDNSVRSWNREVTISSDGKTLTFTNNTINGSADSSGLIPYKIYGCNL